MATSSIIEQHVQDQWIGELERIEKEMERPEMPRRDPARSGLVGRLFGRSAGPSSQERRLDLEMNTDIDARVAVIVAYHLLHVHRRDVVQLLPEALFDGALPTDDEDRFIRLADTAREIVRQHLDQDMGIPLDEGGRSPKLQAIVHALEDDSTSTFSDRLRQHLHASLAQRSHDAELAKGDALLVEIDNVMLGEVDADGAMPYAMDVIVDGHPLATIASIGDGSIEVLQWLEGHGPEDLEALRNYVSEWGEPRSDMYGDRPDSLEELLNERVTVLLTRYAFIEALADAVLFCDTDENAPGGQVIRVMEIDPKVGRERTWDIVVDEFPDAILLDALNEEDAFTLWLAFSAV